MNPVSGKASPLRRVLGTNQVVVRVPGAPSGGPDALTPETA
jgi:hypothetical protein